VLVLYCFRYKFRRSEILSKEEAAKYGIVKKKVTLESEYETIKNASLNVLIFKSLYNHIIHDFFLLLFQIDINNWENKRGPRPWE